MADSTLQNRLREHAEAFDGLLSLIPAKYYYEEDNSDQWKKKKQTKEEAGAALRAKLNPSTAKNAKDVMDERARKRKLGEIQEVEESEIDGIEKELPKQGSKLPRENALKKQKTTHHIAETTSTSGITLLQKDTNSQAERNRQRQNAKKEKRVRKEQQQREALKMARKPQGGGKINAIQSGNFVQEDHAITGLEGQVPENGHIPSPQLQAEADNVQASLHESNHKIPLTNDPKSLEAGGIEDPSTKPITEASTSSNCSLSPTPIFDALSPSHPSVSASLSTSTSTSSIVPPSAKPKFRIPSVAPEALKARLAARIEALRAARKADGPDGAPARNRQELMEARRMKEEQKRAHKKELRAKARLEEEEERERALERASASARGSPNSFAGCGEGGGLERFSFGRLRWGDGSEVRAEGDGLREAKKGKGPRGGDILGALKKLESKDQRIGKMDEDKRKDIEKKELWAKAKKRVVGERVRDDEGLLKKTLKRKEKAKQKSEKEWEGRKEGVEKAKHVRQKKREGNLQKRREEKSSKGKGKGKGKKVRSRPGFEGSFGKRK